MIMYRIGGRQRTVHASVLGVSVGIPPLMIRGPNIEKSWTVPGGQFDWGGRLLKSNGGAQRCAPCQVSSDPHERRNDVGAVSAADSVKS